MEILPGVHQLRTPIPHSPMGHLNAYLIRGTDGYLLIDTGLNTPETFEILEKQLADIDVNLTDISQTAITHFHLDHCGLAGQVKELAGAQLITCSFEDLPLDLERLPLTEGVMPHADDFASEIEAQLKEDGMPENELTFLTGMLPMARAVMPSASVVFPDVTVKDGDTVSTGEFNFNVMWTPGHSPDHMCFYESSKGFLISGDHILPGITPNIGFGPWSGDDPLGYYLASLKKTAQIESELVLPAHEEVFEGLHRRIQELLDHHERRLAAIMQAARTEAKVNYQIAGEIPWEIQTAEGDKVVNFEGMNVFDKWLALGETLSHINLLKKEGKIESCLRDDGCMTYRAVGA